MKKVLFDIKYKEKIINGSAKVFYNNDCPVRIICWDRNTGDGSNSIVGLMKSPSCSLETIITISDNGTVSIPTMGITSNCIYVHIGELPDRCYRVKYSIMRMTCPDSLWEKYGYKEDKNESFYTNAMRFVNDVVPLHLSELHDELKKRGNWTYDDDEDWKFDFKEGESVVCVNNNAPYELEIGGIYTIRLIDYKNQTVIIKNRSGNSFTISFFDCIDLFTHRHECNEKFDFTTLKAFTPVLARTGDHQTWFPHFFESYHPQNSGGEFYMLDDQHSFHRYSQCVPYEGNEHLLRTQDPIPEKYKL